MSHLFNQEKFIKKRITGRPVSLFNTDLQNFNAALDERLNDKSVLVIGGAGTIGSSFIKAVLKFKIKKLYVVDINENGLTELVRDIRSSSDCLVPADLKTYPINFGDPVFEKIIRANGPFHIVANFAAHKHVRSEKDEFSIEAMIENNVVKAYKLLEILKEFPPERFFCVSTDKAANPVNVMGASKKLMEDTIIAYANTLQIVTARFANVAFSNGSLLQGFIERLMKQQPLSSPSNIKRYFVSPQEAGELCLIACVLGDSGDIFFPKLDPDSMVTFREIALAMLEEMGLGADICASEEEAREKANNYSKDSKGYPVYFFESDTSGEKPYEEFYTDAETIDNTKFHSLGVIKDTQGKSLQDIQKMLDALQASFRKGETTKSGIINLIKTYLPNFEHIEKGLNLDQRM